MSLFDERLTYELRGCFFDVQNELGLGLPELAYHKGLQEAFADRGISAISKRPIWLASGGRNVVELRPDFIVEGRVVLELKALRENFAREHEMQLFSYLKATKLRLGFLVNFGREKIHDWRRVYDEKPFAFVENWGDSRGPTRIQEREACDAIRAALLAVGSSHGLGYGEVVYWKLWLAALRPCGQSLRIAPRAAPQFREQCLGEFNVDCAVVNESVVCVLTALREGICRFDIRRAQSYARNLGLRWSVAANFGKDKLELQAAPV